VVASCVGVGRAAYRALACAYACAHKEKGKVASLSLNFN
jgi:hypothetical protein